MSDTDKTDSEVELKVEPTKKKTSRKKAPKAKPAVAPKRRGRVYQFEQWATRRGVAQHHKGGMRAFVLHVHKPRTLEEWDECFKDY